jgi:hypothetical protein
VPELEALARSVAEILGVEVAALRSGSRLRSVVRARKTQDKRLKAKGSRLEANIQKTKQVLRGAVKE